MENISMVQALDIWSELWKAYYGDNGYGGNEAEIYLYRVSPESPSKDPEVGKDAARSLYHLLVKFRDEMECEIIVDNKPLLLGNIPTIHRCHVRIIK